MSEAIYVIKQAKIFELHPEPDGGYSIFIPALPGCTSFGETIDQALENVEEAISLWVDVAREKGLTIPDEFDLKRAS